MVVIGYGFGDEGINQLLEENFLTKGKEMIVIDPKIPNNRLIEDYNTNPIDRSLIDLEIDDWRNLIR